MTLHGIVSLSWPWIGRGFLVMGFGLVFAFLCSIALWNRHYLERIAESRARLPGGPKDLDVVRKSAKRTALAGVVIGCGVALTGLVFIVALGIA